MIQVQRLNSMANTSLAFYIKIKRFVNPCYPLTQKYTLMHRRPIFITKITIRHISLIPYQCTNHFLIHSGGYMIITINKTYIFRCCFFNTGIACRRKICNRQMENFDTRVELSICVAHCRRIVC